jgi:hypothetical protein
LNCDPDTAEMIAKQVPFRERILKSLKDVGDQEELSTLEENQEDSHLHSSSLFSDHKLTPATIKIKELVTVKYFAKEIKSLGLMELISLVFCIFWQITTIDTVWFI